MSFFMKSTLIVMAMVVAGSTAIADDFSQHDKIKIAVQKICPVSGQQLGAHGAPIKVKIGEEEVFLCCKGCLKGQVNAEHWAAIHANFAAAQGICPVMKHELPAKPKWTVVNGQIIFVCCPPCTEKIAADPEGFIKKIDELYQASLQKETRR